jgi:hypothetical protein
MRSARSAAPRQVAIRRQLTIDGVIKGDSEMNREEIIHPRVTVSDTLPPKTSIPTQH